ncbi:MAG: hypothetical protein GVY08_10910 [Bacteroidetes bacterium]|jgi:hypothetical protein|nr:hypothetical protein [Bacteroidota bacterium]
MYKTIIISILAAFTAHIVDAQSVLSPALAETLSLADVENRDQVIYLVETGEPATGIVEEYHESGQIKSRRSVVTGKADGRVCL